MGSAVQNLVCERFNCTLSKGGSSGCPYGSSTLSGREKIVQICDCFLALHGYAFDGEFCCDLSSIDVASFLPLSVVSYPVNGGDQALIDAEDARGKVCILVYAHNK